MAVSPTIQILRQILVSQFVTGCHWTSGFKRLILSGQFELSAQTFVAIHVERYHRHRIPHRMKHQETVILQDECKLHIRNLHVTKPEFVHSPVLLVTPSYRNSEEIRIFGLNIWKVEQKCNNFSDSLFLVRPSFSLRNSIYFEMIGFEQSKSGFFYSWSSGVKIKSKIQILSR